MDKDKLVLKYCSNYYKIINFEYYEGDFVTDKLIKIYRDYIFNIDFNNIDNIKQAIKLDKIIAKYIDDYFFRREMSEGLRKIKVSINECKNLFLSFWRKNVSFDYNDNISYSNQNDNIMPFILKLPTKYRTIIFLYYYEGYKIDEIAHILNLSSTNIQTILYRAREKLKEMLKED